MNDALEKQIQEATQEAVSLKSLREKFLLLAETGDRAAVQHVRELEKRADPSVPIGVVEWERIKSCLSPHFLAAVNTLKNAESGLVNGELRERRRLFRTSSTRSSKDLRAGHPEKNRKPFTM
jgi:hypothetical protein